MPDFSQDVHFACLLHGESASIDLWAIALEIARDEYPDLSVEVWRRRLSRLGRQLRDTVAQRARPEQAIQAITRFLFMKHGFRGNREEYYDPQNSFLNRVLERKLGIPITLSLVYLAVSEWLDLELRGVCMPGHFILRCTLPGHDVFVDPFHSGMVMDREACERRVSQVAGFPVTLISDQLEPAPAEQIILRLLGNLKAIYVHQGDSRRGVRVQERILALDYSPAQLRDLGVLYLRAGRPGLAIDRLERYCELEPEAQDGGMVGQLLEEAHRLQLSLN